MAYGKEKKTHLGGYIINITDHGDPNSYATEVWDEMISAGIKSVLDIGCGEGHSTKYFLDKGIKCVGVEGGEIAYNNSPVKDDLVLHDYTEGPFVPIDKFDAAWCCEFVEHVDEKYCQNFLDSFSKCDFIFMTHANIGQEGYHHVNCQNSEYWIEKIEKIGFYFSPEMTKHYKKLSPQCMHLKNLIVFKK